MKGWLHLFAALSGLVVAALIVFLVFGSASQEGARNEGQAPNAQQGNRLCGTVAPGDAGGDPAVGKAREALPTIIDDKGVQVVPSRAADRDWFARLHAAASLCVDEVTVNPQQLVVAVSYPADTPEERVQAHTYALLGRAFSKPLRRSVVDLQVNVGEKRRTARVSLRAWQNFQSARAARRLPPTINGLRTFKRQVGYGNNQLRFSGW